MLVEEVITQSQMYWITRCDSIKHAAHVGSVITFSISIILILMGFCVVGLDVDSKVLAVLKKMSKFTLVLLCPMLLALIFVPSTKEMAAIIVVPEIANNKDVQQLGSGLVELAKEWMIELKPKSK